MPTEAMFYKPGKDQSVHCYLCAQHCHIENGHRGFCGVRRNTQGRLYTEVYGRVIARHVDPIEKKPLYHFMPGAGIYSIAAPGCNFRCGFCQNWQISQMHDKPEALGGEHVAPEAIVAAALDRECPAIAYTYTEPTIFFEYALDTSRLAREKGIANVFVTNGFMTAAALETIAPYLDAANVDLKSGRDRYYRDYCQARVAPVQETIRRMKNLGIWLEVTTLIIPGENDSDEELAEMAEFIGAVDRQIPWHLSRFMPQYRFGDRPMTPSETLDRAADIARHHGLAFVYQGNVPDGGNHTVCPQCGQVLVHRSRRGVDASGLIKGHCRKCSAKIPGVWV